MCIRDRIYLFLLPGIAYLVLFSYVPMYGLTLAFKDFKISAGILGSPWADPIYKNFVTKMCIRDRYSI